MLTMTTAARALAAGVMVLGLAGCVDELPVEDPTTAPAAEETPASAEPAAEETPDENMSLSEALCSDLEAGHSPMSIWGGVRDQYTPQQFADYAYGAVAISCPDQLASNKALRVFLEAWNIDPDA